MPLHVAPLADLAGFAADQIEVKLRGAQKPSRLILVDSLQLDWQRARCRQNGYRLIAAVSLLLGAATLERWLWQRLQQALLPGSDTDSLTDNCSNNPEGGHLYVEA